MKEKLQQVFSLAKAERRLALIPFLTAGIPSRESFGKQLQLLAQEGADIIEIGVPFSDPVADGPVVEEASLKALDQGVNLDYIFEVLAATPLESQKVLMGYFNPFYQYGLEKLLQKCLQCDISGLIIPDLPLEEYLNYFPQDSKVSYIPLIGLNTSRERMQAYSQLNPPFVYMVSILGLTGSELKVEEILSQQLKLAREVFKCPLVLGFGLSSPEQLDPIKQYLDGVVFGSSLIRYLQNQGTVEGFLQKWKITL